MAEEAPAHAASVGGGKLAANRLIAQEVGAHEIVRSPPPQRPPSQRPLSPAFIPLNARSVSPAPVVGVPPRSRYNIPHHRAT